MAISDKLNYLIETKSKFKDRLNLLGAEIIESTTFRNYLNWLDTFYGEVSDKTDLSINGVVGRTSQESTTGKNLFDKSLITTIGGTIKYIPINVKKNTDYTLSTNSGTSTLANVFLSTTNSGVTTNNNGAMIDQPRTINSGDNNIMYVGYRNDLSSYWIQLEESSTATSYEPYTGGQPSPSPDYPQEINNLSGDMAYKVRGKNKLNINASNYSKNGITSSTSNQAITFNGTTSVGWTSSDFNDCFLKANENYIFSISNSNAPGEVKFRIWGYEDESSSLSVNASANTTFTPSKNITKIKIVCEQMTTNKNYNIEAKCQIEKGSTPTEYEPYISESFPLSLKSRNLFDKNNANIIKCGISYHKINASDSNRLLYISIQPNTTYTIQRRNDGNVNRFRAGTCSIVPTNGVDLDNAIEADNAESITITSRENDTYLAVMYYRTQETILTEQQILDSIQIEEGSTATTYEPYYDIELCKISTYKDRIYKQNDKWYLKKNIGKVVFDGSESWTINTSYTYNVFYRTLDNYARISNAQTTYCEYYKGIENAGGIANFGNNYNNSIGVRTANDNIKDIYISNNSITSASDFKTWLSTHNTEVQYVLATLTTTEITQENYPTLYSQLLAIQEFLTKYKINKEFLLDYSSLEIEY